MTPEQITNPAYRYTLRRTLTDAAKAGAAVRTVVWVMLNPSTADDLVDDPTIRKVMHLSREHGYDELVVVNLFAARSTQPKHLIEMGDKARGDLNMVHIDAAFHEADAIVFAWGAWWTTNVSKRRNLYPGLPRLNVERLAAKIATPRGIPILCCGKTKDRDPKHPCYLPNDTKLVPW